ncbi:MAG: dockerin type I domain-containing protein [Planctomycetota bacterium]|nr:dockerin type I domain-containing protein [Planctomycetota bacterium]
MVASVNDSNGNNDQIRLKRFNIDGTGAGVPVVLAGKVTAVGNTLVIDLGSRGVDDGYYALELDLTGDGSIDRTLRFHRLFGDVNGDGVVDGVDYVAIAGQLNRANAAPYFDLNFDGRVDVNDLVSISRLLGRRIGRGLALDD